jgi:hypothetical protein
MAVQTTIDRIVFLRISEDRKIEPYGRMRDLEKRGRIYAELTQFFRQADAKYNSGLFHFTEEKGRGEPDTLTLKLHIGDEPLRKIIRNLYYPTSPYEFSVLPADILGQVYERFLGKVIELDAGGKARVEEKPEVRKAGGVYYTPTYIVDYIVKNTVGKLLEGKTPDEVSRLKILDPACGSGSFLLGAFQYLIDWHVDYYTQRSPKAHLKADRIRETNDAARPYALTTAEKKRILLNNLFGVDLDQQAVEVTKLSLLLKVLEGETSTTAQPQLMSDRVLPDLDGNIKWGNSLIGPDFYAGKQMSMFGDEDLYRVKTFDWHSKTSGFGDIMASGGFDVVIGNPPYIRIQIMQEWAAESVEFYKQRYEAAKKGNYDVYVVFVERGLELLNKKGSLGYILPHKFFNAQYGEPLRALIAKGKHLAHVVHFGDQQVFSGATTYTCLLFLDKTSRDEFEFFKANDVRKWRDTGEASRGVIPSENLSGAEWNFNVGRLGGIFDKLRDIPTKLGDVSSIFVGLQTSADKIYVLEEIAPPNHGLVRVRDRNGQEWILELGILKPFLNDVTLSTFVSPISKHWLIFPYRFENGRAVLVPTSEISESYPNTWEYLENNSEILRSRESGRADTDQWYGFIYRKNLTLFESPKLVVQVISLSGKYAYEDKGIYFTGGGNGPYYGVRWSESSYRHSIHYLQGLLNSKLLDSFLHSVSSPFRGGYWSYGKRFIEQIPIRLINFDDKADKAKHDKMVSLVERMLDMHKQFAGASGIARETLQSAIEATDREIDALVYELYGLTDEEIRIVEGG